MADNDVKEGEPLVALKLMVPEDLHRAFQRCLWIQINETGKTQLELMEEVIRNFLMKHGC
nr:hypothetical protein [uncultured Desulfobulbus sp.]